MSSDNKSAANSLTVFVAGGTSNTSAAAIDHLLKSHPKVSVRAGVRDLKKAQQRFGSAHAQRLSFVVHDVKNDNTLTGDKAKDANELKGVDALLIVPPQSTGNRVGTVTAYADAAKAAGVKHIAIITTPAVASPNLTLGKDLFKAEEVVRATGIPATYLRPVFFYENQFGNAGTIKPQSAFYYPVKANALFGQVSVADIGESAANALVEGPAKHGNKAYLISGPSQTWDEVAATYSKVLGRKINFVSADDESAKKAMIAQGFPDFLAAGFVELFHFFESAGAQSPADLKALLGRDPETFEHWLSSRAAAFKA